MPEKYQTVKQIETDWLYKLKKRVLIALVGILIGSIMLSALLLNMALVNDSKDKTQELSLTIHASLKSLMLHGDPGLMQDTLEEIGSSKESIIGLMVLDKTGKIAYSSERADVGKVLDRFTNENCLICHMQGDAVPYEKRALIIKKDNIEIQRNVMLLLNDKTCYGCHDKDDRINGKLIIDRSMRATHKLIFTVEIFMLFFGIVLIFSLYIFLSRSFDRYINEIVRRHSEVTLLYSLVERLSKSIEIEELKYVIVEILRDTLDADEVVIILPKGGTIYRAMLWSSSTNKVARVKINEFDPVSVAVIDWFEGTLKEDLVSENKKEIYLPIEKGGNKLAMIVVKKLDREFNFMRLMMVRAISSHFSVAFENARLYSLAITDELTGLYTKRHFRHIIAREFEGFKKRAERISLLMMDLDDFKNVNDTCGHIVGDNVLRDIGRCIVDSIKQTDIAFRYGGEEFTVILPSTDVKGGIFVADRIRKAVKDFIFEKDDLKLRLTISIGVSNCPDNAVTIHDLIITADKALYEAKRSGKNRVVQSSFNIS